MRLRIAKHKDITIEKHKRGLLNVRSVGRKIICNKYLPNLRLIDTYIHLM